MKRLSWGVLGVSSIANEMVPAINAGTTGVVTAIASRDIQRARGAAGRLSIAKAFGSYEALIADAEVDIVYVGLPNHLHAKWAIAAMEAGKHVLVEKPLAASVIEAQEMLSIQRKQRVQVGEAFTFRAHPQWSRVHELLHSGAIGDLRTLIGQFAYNNMDRENIRNRTDCFGGALMDVGCYLVHASRHAFGRLPSFVNAISRRDPQFGTDSHTSAILDFEHGQALLTCGTQSACTQRFELIGTAGRIILDTPFNAPQDVSAGIEVWAPPFFGNMILQEHISGTSQQTRLADAFGKAVMEEGTVPVSLEDALENVAVVQAIVASSSTGRRSSPRDFISSAIP